MNPQQYFAYLRGDYRPSPHPQMPHCDGLVLHAPGECEFCDRHPDWQRVREEARINFTGHRREGFAPCPAEARRPVAAIHSWHGNRPTEVPLVRTIEGLPDGDAQDPE